MQHQVPTTSALAGTKSSIERTPSPEASRQISVPLPYFACLARDRFLLLVCALFLLLYTPQALIMVSDMGLITAFEIDAGSHLQAIKSILLTYNMHSALHSRYYGWTFFSLNFAIITPIRLVADAFHFDSDRFIYSLVRMILLFVGLSSVGAFYSLLREIFLTRAIAFVGSLLYILSPVNAVYFYLIHPETTGTALICVACIYLVRFCRGPANVQLYYCALVCMVLASLSKQIYFIFSVPLIMCFFHFYCRSEGRSYASFLLSRSFVMAFGSTAILSLLILFIIHPFAILEYRDFVKYQSQFSMFVNGDYAMPVAAALRAWQGEILSVPLFIACLALLPVSLVVSVLEYRNTRNFLSVLSFVNAAMIAFVVTQVVFLNRLLISRYYLHPIYGFAIILYLSALTWARSRPGRIVKRLGFLLLSSGLVIILTSGTYVVGLSLIRRIRYQESIAYKTFSYIKQSVPEGTRIAYDQFVGLPDAFQEYGCHYWAGCGTDYIESFSPEYVVFDADYAVNGKPFFGTERLKKYVADHHLELIAKIEGVGRPDASDRPTTITVSVYRK